MTRNCVSLYTKVNRYLGVCREIILYLKRDNDQIVFLLIPSRFFALKNRKHRTEKNSLW